MREKRIISEENEEVYKRLIEEKINSIQDTSKRKLLLKKLTALVDEIEHM